jgi:UDP-N-acetylmuramate dehydrogenase
MKPTMHTEKNYSLKPYHTFAVDALAKYFVRAESIKDISMILSDRIYKDERKLILEVEAIYFLQRIMMDLF